MKYPEPFDITDHRAVIGRLDDIQPGEHIPYHIGQSIAGTNGRGIAAMRAYTEGRALLVQERVREVHSTFTYWAVGLVHRRAESS